MKLWKAVELAQSISRITPEAFLLTTIFFSYYKCNIIIEVIEKIDYWNEGDKAIHILIKEK